MPELNDVIDKGFLLRILGYGEAKLKKTWWAAKAAEAGFNVIDIDGDDGTHILNNIEVEARKRIKIINAVDELDRPVMAELVTRVLKGKPFLWDETTKRVVVSVPNVVAAHDHMYFNARKLTANDVLLLDSWTALSWSLAFRFATEHSIDLSDANKTEWDGYMWSGNMANWVLSQMAALPCHVIIIAHAQSAEKYKDGKVVSARTQPSSISKNHSKLLAQKFSDLLYFKIVGRSIKIDTNAASDRDGGSRLIPPNVYEWEKLQFKDICKLARIPLPQNASQPEAIKFFPAGTAIPEDIIAPPRGKKPLVASAAKEEKKPSSKGSLLIKSKK